VDRLGINRSIHSANAVFDSALPTSVASSFAIDSPLLPSANSTTRSLPRLKSTFFANHLAYPGCGKRSRMWAICSVLFCSLAVLDQRVDHTTDVLSPFIPVLSHSDWLFDGESCPRLDIVHQGRAWPSSPAWVICSAVIFLHLYLMIFITPLTENLPTDLRPICRAGRTTTIDERSEVRFSIPHRTLPRRPILWAKSTGIHTFALHIDWSDVTESVATIRSPYCGVWHNVWSSGEKVHRVVEVTFNPLVYENVCMITSSPTKRISALSQWKTFMRVLPTRWRRQPAGIKITSLSRYVLIARRRGEISRVDFSAQDGTLLIQVFCYYY